MVVMPCCNGDSDVVRQELATFVELDACQRKASEADECENLCGMVRDIEHLRR